MGNNELVEATGVEVRMDKEPTVRDIPYGSCCIVNNILLTRIKSRQADVDIEVRNPQRKQTMRMYELATGKIHLLDPWQACRPVKIAIEVL